LSALQATHNPESPSGERYEQHVVQSALWAAAGDALGWITELSRGESGVRHRAGVSSVTSPIAWQRTIGGRNGPRVDLPAGTYSDDTQLRLAVSRSIRGNGSFDVETFAKIEVTVWPTYALGGGLGTKAAALNLSRRGVNWFSNFFESSGQKYVNGGGNGAAMRIQPHVWACRDNSEDLIVNVLRDALVTHGHPHGFCGAIFHALALADTLRNETIPLPETWAKFAEQFLSLPRLIANDPQLSAFWRSAWENGAAASLDTALSTIRDEALHDIGQIAKVTRGSASENYREVLERLGCLTTRFRGSGFKTALASLALAHIFREDNVEAALTMAANELESDTDTIATMTGAILGAISTHSPEWQIQDRQYIVQEAERLAAIALKQPQSSFTYPDLGHWNPPAKQTASIGWLEGDLVLAGLGHLKSQGPEYRAGDAVWQWFALPFGQTILAKRRANLNEKISADQLPGPRQDARTDMRRVRKPEHSAEAPQTRLPLDDGRNDHRPQPKISQDTRSSRDAIDTWSDEAIHSEFDDLTLGRLLNRCIDSSQSVDAAIGFAAIVAKAKLARQRRRR
jgi:ADP-ribosylglycohydrolase